MDKDGNGYINITGISKRYGVVQALNDISFSVQKGEIHAILGENGAGKSTLVKVIMGETAPDEGEIILEGEVMKQYSPLYARSRGIQMVHQELAVFENMTVAENIYPWNEFRTRARTVNWKKLNEEAQKQLDLFGLKNIKPDQLMRDLTLDAQQMVEILRCMSANPKVLLLDEPTSGLNDEETKKLIETLKQLRNHGQTILYISHRLKEILDISDRVTTLRDGNYISTLPNDAQLTEEKLINNMVGRDLSSSLYSQKRYDSLSTGTVLFEVKGLSKKNAINDVSFSMKKGEVLGFFGLEGSGSDKLSRIMYGLEGRDEGEVLFKGTPVRPLNPSTMLEKRVLYLNTNRKLAGLLLDMPTTDNIAMPILKKISNFMFMNTRRLQEISEEYIRKFSIAIPTVKTRPRDLSGVNQQKVMLTICLAAEPELLIVNEPTRGIDVGAKAEIHKLLLEFAEKGVGVIIFSSELPELLGLADRVLVMKKRMIAGELEGTEIAENSIMTLAAAETGDTRSETA